TPRRGRYSRSRRQTPSSSPSLSSDNNERHGGGVGMTRGVVCCCAAVLFLWGGSARAQAPVAGGASDVHPVFGVPGPTPPDCPGACGACTPPPAAAPLPEAAAPTAQEQMAALAQNLEALSKHLTVVTADENFKLVLGGAVIADFLFNSRRPVAPGTPFFL